MTLGQTIREARQSKGMTQKELVGDYITRNMLSKIENDSAIPSVRTLEYLAGALGFPTGYFLSGAPVSDGTAPDGLDEARAAYREHRWADCLAALDTDNKAGTTDEGYLLHALAGAAAAREALDAGSLVEARELAEDAQNYNQEGMYGSAWLSAELSLILGTCLTRLGEGGYAQQRAAFLRAFEDIERDHQAASGRQTD